MTSKTTGFSGLIEFTDDEQGDLGYAELDLSKFGKREFNMMELPLKNCQYDNSYIVVGL